MTRLKWNGLISMLAHGSSPRNWLGPAWRRIRISWIIHRAKLRGVLCGLRLGRKPTLAAIQRALIAQNQSVGESLLAWAATYEYGDLPEKEKLQKLEELRTLMEEAGFIPTNSPHG